MNPQAVFDQAQTAFRQGRYDIACKALNSLLQIAPNNAGALHLLALSERALGNFSSARSCFDRARKLAPNDAELSANAANLLHAMKASDEALMAYNTAIALAPHRYDFRMNRAIALLDIGRPKDAIADIDFLAPFEENSAKFWSIAGQIYRAIGELAKAKDAFLRALKIEPERPVPLAALGELLLTTGDNDAISTLQKAHKLLPDELGLTLSFAEALEVQGRFDEATSLLDAATEKHPDWIIGHQSLSRMHSEAGNDDRIIDVFERALLLRPYDTNLWASYAAALQANDRIDEARDLLDRAQKAVGSDMTLALLSAGIATDQGDIALAGNILNALPHDYVAATPVRVRHAIRSGRPDYGADIASRHLEYNPTDIALWALLSLCWRITGDPKEAWLNPDPALFQAIDIGLPNNGVELAAHLRTLHTARRHPAGQSLRSGTQTRGSLFQRQEKVITELREHIRSAVLQYTEQLPPFDALHPLLRYRNTDMDFVGSWSVRLSSGGFHVSHIHPAGIISSAFYVALPDTLGTGPDSQEGWLEVGGAPPELMTGLKPYAVIEPKPGRLALFPSYLFHGTLPYKDGERLTVAFDVAPQ
jgi:tetratricopeptide (TPR) repeat protein